MLFINRFPPCTLTLYFLFAFPAISLLSLSLVQTYDTSQIFSESFFQYTKNFCTVQVLPSRIHTILLYTFLFSKSVAWGESPGWRSRRFAVSTDRTSVSVFNLSRDLKRYKMTFCTKLSQIQSAVQLRWTPPIKKRRLNMPVGTFNRLPSSYTISPRYRFRHAKISCRLGAAIAATLLRLSHRPASPSFSIFSSSLSTASCIVSLPLNTCC